MLKIGGMLEWMPTAESEVQDARRELERVLSSTGFSRNERIARFLRFIVEEHLEGRDSALKESVVSIERMESHISDCPICSLRDER